MSPRQTSTSNVASRTAAANRERRRRFVRQLLERWLWTLPELSTEQLKAVAATIAEELRTREALTDSAAARRDEIPQAGAEFGRAVPNFGEGAHMVRIPGGERVA